MLYMLEAATSTSMNGVLEVLQSVFTYLLGLVGSLVTTVMSQPLLLIPIGITLSYVAVRFFKMIFSLVR